MLAAFIIGMDTALLLWVYSYFSAYADEDLSGQHIHL